MAVAATAQTSAQVEFFEKQVRPVLAGNCQGCHNAKVKSGGLDLSTAEGFVQGGASGALVSKASPEQSLLLRVTSYDDKLKMPPTGKLKPDQLASLKQWVETGAAWPGAHEAKAVRPTEAKEFTEAEKKFWAFQPVSKPALPDVRNTAWIRTPVDRFILAKLEEKGLTPAAPADKLTLLRRATYDLIGLPPTEQEMHDFLADNSPEAFSKVVDRLLASPRYGEKWGRHWLDVARYADSTGNDEDHRYPYAWRYRDYVIRAFNEDMPYDRFIREQIAGDLMPSAGGGLNRQGIVATGYLALGPKAIAQQDKKKMLYDVYDEQIDVVSRGVMGLSISCSRCHDHKFDPIRTRDYYSLVSIFASTRSFADAETHVSKLLFTPLVPKAEYEKYTAWQDTMSRKKFEIEDVIDDELERYVSGLAPRLSDYMVSAHRVSSGGGNAAVVAKERNLLPDVLEKWVKYLQQTDGEAPYLERWHKAPAAELETVAKEYQQEFETKRAEWLEKLTKWRAESRRMLKEGDMPPRPRPTFEPEEGPFFESVYFKRGPFSVPRNEQEKHFSAEAHQRLSSLRKELETMKSQMPPEPDMACAVQEGEPVQQHVFIRGDYSSPGAEVAKTFPAILMRGAEPPPVAGSGRMQLAEWLTRPQHPLTARVMANRIWLWHFGEGIVRTPDNFGRMGERPTHPELLDYLASRFVEGGWSIKAMHRMIMLSNAYQMSSTTSAEAAAEDPENRLLSRFNRRRLDVEEIHDGMLWLDGSLDLTVGGTLQHGKGTDSENSNDRLSMKPEDIRRRMVYVPLRRANLPALLNLFDFGDATTMSGKRALTNVAPQALFAMNSTFIAQQGASLARRLLDRAGLTAGDRVELAYLLALNRKVDAAEVDSALTYMARLREKFPQTSETAALESLCRILLASNEFIYLD